MHLPYRQITTQQSPQPEPAGLLDHGYKIPTEQEKQALTDEFHINPTFSQATNIRRAAAGAVAESEACARGGEPLDRLIRLYETVYLEQLSQYLRRAASDATAKSSRASATILRGMAMAFRLQLRTVKGHGYQEQAERMEKLLRHYKELEDATRAEPGGGSAGIQKRTPRELILTILFGFGLMDLIAYLFPSKWLGPPCILCVIKGKSYVEEWKAVHGVPFAKASQRLPGTDHGERED